MEEKKIIKLRDKGSWHLEHVCPHCGSRKTTVRQRPVQKEITRNKDNYYPGDVEIYHEIADCKCKDCLKEYLVDFGESSYIVYDKPVSRCNTGEVICFAEYKSEMHYNFGLYAAEQPDNESELIYFMKYEHDRFPIFITKNTMEKLLRNCNEASNYAFCTWMTRYR